MNLYIMRHAEAEEVGESGNDDARRLTERGRKRAAHAAAGMTRLELSIDSILTSPLTRARETAEITATALGLPAPEIEPTLAIGRPAADVARWLAGRGEAQSVLIVGHEPQLTALVSLLLTGRENLLRCSFKKGAIVALELGAADVGNAGLLWMMTQRQLIKLRK